MIPITALVLISMASPADAKPNFTGKWVLDKEKSDFGGYPVPDTRIELIEHEEPHLKQTQTQKGKAVPGGEQITERHYTTDGKENVNKIGPSNVKSTSKWEGRKLVTVAEAQTPNGPLKITDVWELADGGKQMIMSRIFKNADGERNQKRVFQKH